VLHGFAENLQPSLGGGPIESLTQAGTCPARPGRVPSPLIAWHGDRDSQGPSAGRHNEDPTHQDARRAWVPRGPRSLRSVTLCSITVHGTLIRFAYLRRQEVTASSWLDGASGQPLHSGRPDPSRSSYVTVSGCPATSSELAPDDVFGPLIRIDVDPLPWLARHQEAGPVARLDLFGNPVWLVTRYADVRAVLADTTAFSNDFAHLAAADGEGDLGLSDPGGLGFRDAPDHTRLRRMLAPAFTARSIAALEPVIRRVVEERLDALAAAGPGADLVREFADQVPALVIGELLGVPRHEQVDFAALAAGRFDVLQSILAPLDSAAQSLALLRDLVARERTAPGPGLLGHLVRTHGDAVDDEELAGLVDGLLVGGHETTASMLALSVLLLLRDPDAARRLRQDPTAVPGAVEELLRHLTVVQVAFPRFARTDLDLGGQRIAAGELVLCSLSAADRDPRWAEGLDDLRLDRPIRQHLAFGHGAHHCLGAPLARLELQIALPAILQRFPGLQVAEPGWQPPFRQRSIVFGLESLPVRW
jgi:cytochrome P450